MGKNNIVVVQNLKTIVVMKSCGKTDPEIAKQIGLTTIEFLNEIEEDSYLKECYDKAAEKVATDVEMAFLEVVFKKLEQGDTTDAKFVLERTNKRYQKRDVLDLNVKTIDDVIRENDGEK